MSQKTVFSSAHLPAHLNDRDRFSLWHEIHVAEIWSVEYSISGKLPFEAAIEATAVGSLVIGDVAGTIQHTTRKASNIAHDGHDGYLLLINKAETLLTGAHVGRAYGVGQGEALLITASEALKMTGADTNRWTNVVVPRAILERAFPGIDDRLALKIGTENEALNLLKGYCQLFEAGASGASLVSPDLIAHATETIVDLIGLATGAKGEATELAGLRGLRAARLQAILAMIANNFADPAISAQGVAQGLGLSPRYVQDLLQQTGISFSERVLELRLLRTFKMLSERHSDGMRISDIALICGFNDVTYFNRCFRRRFGMTPKGAR